MNKQRDAMRFLHMGCGESLRSSGLLACCGVRTGKGAPRERRPARMGTDKGRRKDEEQR